MVQVDAGEEWAGRWSESAGSSGGELELGRSGLRPEEMIQRHKK